jgi:hypothetical protein
MAGFDDRRSEARTARMLAGKVQFNDITRDCTILDLSKSGARLKLTGFSGLPGKFDLLVPDRGTTYRSHVQWQFGDEVGVAFDLGVVALASEQGDLAKRVQQLEASLAELRKLVADELGRKPRDRSAA